MHLSKGTIFFTQSIREMTWNIYIHTVNIIFFFFWGGGVIWKIFHANFFTYESEVNIDRSLNSSFNVADQLVSSASLPDSITASSFELLDAKHLKRKLAMFCSAALQRLKDKLKFTVISPASADLGRDGQLVLVCVPLRRRRKMNGVCVKLYLGHMKRPRCGPGGQNQSSASVSDVSARVSIRRCIEHHSEAVRRWPYGFMKSAFATNMSFPIISQSGCEAAFYLSAFEL